VTAALAPLRLAGRSWRPTAEQVEIVRRCRFVDDVSVASELEHADEMPDARREMRDGAFG
jgi:hypothetical protein